MEEIPLWYSLAVFFVLGACVGSFYNVIVYRMPRGISLINPPSHCPLCKKHIPLYYNLPIVGWLILRGKSACCKQPISIIYPIGESLCGLLGALALYAATGFTTNFTAPVQSFEVWADALALFWLLLGIYPVSAVDFKYKLIPDSISVGGIVAGLIISFIPGGMTPVESIVGAVAAGGGLYLLGWVEAGDDRLPYIHTTNMRGGELVDVGYTRRGLKESVKGYGLLIPRVCNPNKEKLVILEKEECVLSDCVVLLQTRSRQQAERLRQYLLAHWDEFKKNYVGTGARYVTMERLRAYFRL